MDNMLADYMTKSLVGRKFTYFQSIVLNFPISVEQEECVGTVPKDNDLGLNPKSMNHNDKHPMSI